MQFFSAIVRRPKAANNGEFQSQSPCYRVYENSPLKPALTAPKQAFYEASRPGFNGVLIAEFHAFQASEVGRHARPGVSKMPSVKEAVSQSPHICRNWSPKGGFYTGLGILGMCGFIGVVVNGWKPGGDPKPTRKRCDLLDARCSILNSLSHFHVLGSCSKAQVHHCKRVPLVFG